MPSHQRWQVPGAVPWLRFNLKYVTFVCLVKLFLCLGCRSTSSSSTTLREELYQNPHRVPVRVGSFGPRSPGRCSDGTCGFVELRAARPPSRTPSATNLKLLQRVRAT